MVKVREIRGITRPLRVQHYRRMAKIDQTTVAICRKIRLRMSQTDGIGALAPGRTEELDSPNLAAN